MQWLWWAIGLLGLGAAATITIHYVITKQRIKEEAKKKFAEAIKAVIKSKEARTVNVGIFGPADQTLGDMTITSDMGVVSTLNVGDVISLTA